MSPLEKKRIAAVKTADAINAIEGAPISSYARSLSASWARGELTGVPGGRPRKHRRKLADEAGIAGTSPPDRGAGASEPCLIHTCMKMCLS